MYPSTNEYKSAEQYSAESLSGSTTRLIPGEAASDSANQRAERKRPEQNTSLPDVILPLRVFIECESFIFLLDSLNVENLLKTCSQHRFFPLKTMLKSIEKSSFSIRKKILCRMEPTSPNLFSNNPPTRNPKVNQHFSTTPII